MGCPVAWPVPAPQALARCSGDLCSDVGERGRGRRGGGRKVGQQCGGNRPVARKSRRISGGEELPSHRVGVDCALRLVGGDRASPPHPQARTQLGVIQYPSLPRGWPHRRSGARRNRYRGGSAHPRRWQSVRALTPPVWRGGPHYQTWGANRGRQPPAMPAILTDAGGSVSWRGAARTGAPAAATDTHRGGRESATGEQARGRGGGGNPAATVAKDLRGGLVVGLPSIRPPRRMPSTAATIAPPAVPMV